MQKFTRFLVLAVIGFALGAGFAFLQQKDTMPAPPVPVEQAAAPVEAAPAETAVAGSQVGGAFSLTDHNGNAVTEQSWPGKMKLVFFGFTNCPDICPAALGKITAALEAIGADADKIQPIFITTDPERDTVDVMKVYVANYHPALVGLTGDAASLKAAQDAYKVYAAKVPAAPAADAHAGHEGHEGHEGHSSADYMIDHSAYVYLIGEGEQLLEIFGKDSTADEIAVKLKERIAGASVAAAPADEVAPVADALPAAAQPVAPAEEVDPLAAPAAESEASAPAAESEASAPAAESETPAPAAESETPAPAAESETPAPAAEAEAATPVTEEPAAPAPEETPAQQ